MKTIKYTTVDKSKWMRGIWDNEPDKVQYPDKSTGLPCLIVRGPHGGWCGYVGVPEGHPWFQKDYNDVDAQVHGGLTYAHFCAEGMNEAYSICHIPGPGEPDRVWWLGFDCAHYGDIMPAYEGIYSEYSSRYKDLVPYKKYRDIGYVKKEVRSLAKQAAKAEG